MTYTTSPRNVFVFILLLVFASGASCPRRLPTADSLIPTVFQQPPSAPEIVAALNMNAQRVTRLEASGATLSITGLPSLKTSLALQLPKQFRMIAGTGVTGTELDIGSNDESFWMWAKRNQPPGIYVARHDEFLSSAARQILPLPPQWLIEAIGLVQLDPQAKWEGPFTKAAGRVEIRTHQASSEELLTKTFVVDDRRGVILEQHVYDSAGQLLATALNSQHHYDATFGISLPRRIDIQLPTAGLAFTLEVESFALNQLGSDPAQLFAQPDVPGVQVISLAHVAPPQPLITARGPAGYRTGDDFMPQILR